MACMPENKPPWHANLAAGGGGGIPCPTSLPRNRGCRVTTEWSSAARTAALTRSTPDSGAPRVDGRVRSTLRAISAGELGTHQGSTARSDTVWPRRFDFRFSTCTATSKPVHARPPAPYGTALHGLCRAHTGCAKVRTETPSLHPPEVHHLARTGTIDIRLDCWDGPAKQRRVQSAVVRATRDRGVQKANTTALGA
jgi:hypothetical protein